MLSFQEFILLVYVWWWGGGVMCVGGYVCSGRVGV